MVRKFAAGVALLCLCPRISEGRLSYAWTFDELRAKSDVVVIAERLGTYDTNTKALLHDIQPAFPVVELGSEFKVLTLFKGVIKSKTFTLRHYRTDSELIKGPIANGPIFLDFSSEPTAVYLLFLVLEPDGRYAPTSGQVDPDDAVVALPKNATTVFPR